MTKAWASVRPRMKASGATSISPLPRRFCELVGRQHVVERIEDRPQIGVDLLAQIARQKAEPLAGLDRGPRQDDPLDLAGHQQIDRGGDREIGLAGAGGAEPEHQLVLAHRLDVRRPAPAVRGAMRRLRVRNAGIVAPQAEALVVDLGLRQAHRRLDRGDVDLVAALEPLVEARQRRAGRPRWPKPGPAIDSRLPRGTSDTPSWRSMRSRCWSRSP